MNFFQRLWAARNQNSWDKFISGWLAGADDVDTSGIVSVAGDSALKFNALNACCRVLGETFASVPVFEYKKIDDKSREKTDDTGVYDILHNAPNEEMCAFNYKEMSAYDINLGGNHVSIRQKNKFGELLYLNPVNRNALSIEREEDPPNRLVYKVRNEKTGEIKTYYRQDVFHVPGPSLNGIVGMSPIQFAAESIKLGMTWEQIGNKLFKNGVFPTGVFEHPGELGDDPFARLQKQIDSRWGGGNVGRPIISEDGMKFTPLKVDLAAIQLIESKRFSAEDICRIYRVPPHLIQDLSRSTNNNIEHQSLEFVMYTMLPWFKRWEENINTQLLTREQRREGYYFEFNIASLLRGDQKSMAEAFAVGRQWGWLSVNDIRRLLNMNPIEGGDIYLQPMNMVPAGTMPEKSTSTNQKIIDEIQRLIESTNMATA